MGGLPKFLLPLPSKNDVNIDSQHALPDTLLGFHVELGLECTDLTLISSRPENMLPLMKYAIPGRVEIVCMETHTMSETVQRMSTMVHSTQYLVTMPDTFFAKSDFKLESLKIDGDEGLRLALWPVKQDQIGSVGQVEIGLDGLVKKHSDKDPNCEFPQVWGALSFRSESLELIDPSEPHVGFMIPRALEQSIAVSGNLIKGEYIDCGTPEGYGYLLASK